MNTWQPNPMPDEPPEDDEIRGWFRAIGAPSQPQAPPFLPAKVKARIASQPPERRVAAWRWLGRALSFPVWVSVMAIALFISLSAHVWLGLSGGGSPTQVATDATPILPTYQLQRQAQHPETLRATRPSVREPADLRRGFAPQASAQAQRLDFFRMGASYANALAALQHDQVEVAAQHLEHVAERLKRTPEAPSTLGDYLHGVQSRLQQPQYRGRDLAKFLALFETLYITEYQQRDAEEAVTLFQIGAWLETMSMAATTADPVILSQARSIDALLQGLTRIQVPPVALDTLRQLRHLVVQPRLSEEGRRRMQTYTEALKRILGAV